MESMDLFQNDDLSKYDTSSDTNSTDVDTIPPSASGSKSKAGVLNDAFEYEVNHIFHSSYHFITILQLLSQFFSTHLIYHLIVHKLLSLFY